MILVFLKIQKEILFQLEIVFGMMYINNVDNNNVKILDLLQQFNVNRY